MDTAILIIVNAIVTYGVIFLTAYFTEKGKNLATKEDIEDLTDKVESVKIEYASQLALLQSNINRLYDNEINFRSEERGCTIAYHDAINKWIYSILEVKFNSYSIENIDNLLQNRNDIAKYYAICGIAITKLDLLIEDKLLKKLAHDVYLATLKYYHWNDKQFLLLQHKLLTIKNNYDLFLVYLNAVPVNPLSKEIADRDLVLKAELEELQKNYYSLLQEEYAKVIPIIKAFQKQTRTYLKS